MYLIALQDQFIFYLLILQVFIVNPIIIFHVILLKINFCSKVPIVYL